MMMSALLHGDYEMAYFKLTIVRCCDFVFEEKSVHFAIQVVFQSTIEEILERKRMKGFQNQTKHPHVFWLKLFLYGLDLRRALIKLLKGVVNNFLRDENI
jgi:hypothetical protein